MGLKAEALQNRLNNIIECPIGFDNNDPYKRDICSAGVCLSCIKDRLTKVCEERAELLETIYNLDEKKIWDYLKPYHDISQQVLDTMVPKDFFRLAFRYIIENKSTVRKGN